MSHNIRNPEIEGLLRDFGLMIREVLPDGWGFNLLLFEFGERGALFYISDAQREDILRVMKEWIARNEH